jgi:hypothetical protein
MAHSLDDRYDDAVAEINERHREEAGRKAMWRTHHHPDQYDRCIRVGGLHYCRRCVTLYPVAFLFAALTLAGLSLWPEQLDLWFIWLPCIPATLDFVLEQLQMIRYSARRQLWSTLVLAPALGRGLGHELDDSFSWELWGPVLVFCTIWFFAAIAGHRRRGMF